MLVNLSFTLTLCNYSSRYLRHLNFICTEPRKKAISPGGIFSRPVDRPRGRTAHFISRGDGAIVVVFIIQSCRKAKAKKNFRRAIPVRRVCRLRRRSRCTTLQHVSPTNPFCGCACARDAINISFPAPISFGFQCKCKTARNSRWQVTRLADGTPVASLQRLHKTQRAVLLTATDLSYTYSITMVDSIIRDTLNRVILIATSLRP